MSRCIVGCELQQLVKCNAIAVNPFSRMHVTVRIRCVLDLADSRCVMNTQMKLWVSRKSAIFLYQPSDYQLSKKYFLTLSYISGNLLVIGIVSDAFVVANITNVTAV